MAKKTKIPQSKPPKRKPARAKIQARAHTRVPARVHPGEVLRKRFMEPLGLSANALALALRVPATRIGDLLNGRRAISADTALRLARYFGTPARFWLDLQIAYDLAVAAAERGAVITRDVYPRAA